MDVKTVAHKLAAIKRKAFKRNVQQLKSRAWNIFFPQELEQEMQHDFTRIIYKAKFSQLHGY